MHRDLSKAYVFACGAPAMVQMARDLFVSDKGLSEDRFYFDSFESPVGRPASMRESDSTVTLIVSLPNGSLHQVPCRAGQSLMSALVAENLVKAICGGSQSCGTCRVTLAEADFSSLPEVSRSESRLLRNLPDSGPYDRLSCQLEVRPEHEGLFVAIPSSDF
jgi:CDP-4-dehydro-6-deoxyglucose reductase, E3